MKRLLLAVLMVALFLSKAQAQNVEGQIIAAQYGEFQVPGQTIGGFQFPAATCQVSGGGKNFDAFSAGTPIKIVDANPSLTEIATPSSVFITGCSVNMATVHQHVPPYYLTSGTGGLQEAITANQTNNGINSIILNWEWYREVPPGNPATVIASVKGISQLSLVDVTTSPYTWYSWNGTTYVAQTLGGGVTSINGTPGAFIFSGGGVSCTATACVFSGGTAPVSSVFGRTGAVVAVSGDYSLALISPGAAGTGIYDFSGSTNFKLPVVAGYTGTASGECGHDSTNHNFHCYDNGADNFVAIFPSASPPTSGHLAGFVSTGGAWTLGDVGAPTGSTKVIYTSKIAGVTGGVAVVPGSSATGTTDSAGVINTAIAGGNVDLEVDSGYALSTSLVVSSNTTIHCIAPQYGFIMQTSSNAPVIINAHNNSPTTSSGTGGYLPSNITDQNITVSGCTLNANSTQAVTGSNYSSIPHTVNPGTGLFVFGSEFVGVNNLLFDHNELYDSGCWNLFISNATNVRVQNSFMHQPLPLVASKSTDGIHFIGPDQFIWLSNNRINSGDDAVAWNADDGNRTGSGDPNASYVPTYVKWGWITDAVEDSTTLDGVISGGRLLSATELIDRLTISNLHGTSQQDFFLDISALYPSLGTGNMGNIVLDNVHVYNTTGNSAGYCGQILIRTNFDSIQIRGLVSNNPVATSYSIVCQMSGAGGILSIHDWDISTLTTQFPNIIALNGGSIAQVAASGISWLDGGAGPFFAGSAVPGILTCSNYAGPGPNRLLASGFSPATKNGDCFTNTYGVSVPAAIHRWPMNEGTGTTLHDTIGTTNLTTTSVTWATSTGMGTPSVAIFNGTSSFAIAGAVDSTLNFNGSQPMTVAYWANFVTSGGAPYIVIGDLEASTGGYQGWEVGTDNTSGFMNFLVVGALTTNQMTANGNVAVTANTGKCYVTTYTGSLNVAGVKQYINGVVQSSSDSSGTLTSGSASNVPVLVGARDNGNSWLNAALGYMYVWNQALTSSQVSAFCGLGPQ